MKQIPAHKDRRAAYRVDHYDGNYYATETNTEYVNKHATEWKPPLGSDLHLHLVYSHTVHWRVVTRGSSVCKVPGRCRRVSVLEMGNPGVAPDNCPDRSPPASGEAAKVVASDTGLVGPNPESLPDELKAGDFNADFFGDGGPLPDGLNAAPHNLDYDARHVNWPRLAERMLSSTYNALFYGALIVAAKVLGIL